MNINSINSMNIFKKQYSDPQMLSMLQALGIKPTGSIEGDIAAISKAQAQNQIKEIDSDKAAFPMKGAKPELPPWVALMESLGLKPTGSKEGDYALLMARVAELRATASTDSQKSNVDSLESQIATLFSQGESAATGNIQDSFIGMNQLGAMNKQFFML